MGKQGAKNRAAKAIKAKAAERGDLVDQLEASRKAQQQKLEQSIAHLTAQLDVASHKYLTVNGYMQARSTLDQVLFGKELDHQLLDSTACAVAEEMSGIAQTLAAALGKIDPHQLDESFLDDLLDEDFVSNRVGANGVSPEYTTKQMLIVNLLQNIGPSIDDIEQFRDSTDGEIKNLEARISEIEDEISELESNPESAPDDGPELNLVPEPALSVAGEPEVVPDPN